MCVPPERCIDSEVAVSVLHGQQPQPYSLGAAPCPFSRCTVARAIYSSTPQLLACKSGPRPMAVRRVAASRLPGYPACGSMPPSRARSLPSHISPVARIPGGDSVVNQGRVLPRAASSVPPPQCARQPSQPSARARAGLGRRTGDRGVGTERKSAEPVLPSGLAGTIYVCN